MVLLTRPDAVLALKLIHPGVSQAPRVPSLGGGLPQLAKQFLALGGPAPRPSQGDSPLNEH
eukprot:3526862-Alexandrium_andersonii.AAC.1